MTYGRRKNLFDHFDEMLDVRGAIKAAGIVGALAATIGIIAIMVAIH